MRPKHWKGYSNTSFRSRAVVVNSTQSTKPTRVEAKIILPAVSLRRSAHVIVSSFQTGLAICNVANGMSPHQHIRHGTNHVLATSTPITLSPHISSVVKFATSNSHMILHVGGRSNSAPASKPSTKISICRGSQSSTLFPSSIYLHMARSAKLNTPSITLAVWDAYTVRPLSRNGHT